MAAVMAEGESPYMTISAISTASTGRVARAESNVFNRVVSFMASSVR
jgi:hypothetical protein